MKIISIVNPKGGAAKTVSAVNISYALVNREYKTLLIDTDPRGAVEMYLGLSNENTIFELVKEQYEFFGINDFEKYITHKNGLDIITSNFNISKIDKFFDNDIESELDSISDIKYLFSDYDFIIFDTEGTVNNLTKAILKVTDYIFTPTQTSVIDVNGIRDLLNTFKIAKRKNPNLEVKKIFIVRAKMNTNAYKDFREQLKTYFNETQFSDVSIREDQNIINSMSKKTDILTYRNSSNAAIDYRNLVDEFLEEIN
jgi:chromosome partitioning protein